mgnify:CR=1 FL=1
MVSRCISGRALPKDEQKFLAGEFLRVFKGCAEGNRADEQLFLPEYFEHLRAADGAHARHGPALPALAGHGHLLRVFHGALLAALYAITFIH